MERRRHRQCGFTLIELLAALLILSLLALMAYRGLAAVMQAREQVRVESEKWRRTSAFFLRFERDIGMAAPRDVGTSTDHAAAWLGRVEPAGQPLLEFSRFGSAGGVDSARRLGYRLNGRSEIELWSWTTLDAAANAEPTRYPVLTDVEAFELQYLDSHLAWSQAWPLTAGDPLLPRAVRVRIVLVSGEELVRVFALAS